MGQSIVVDWLNENQFRMYPLTEDSGRTAGGYNLTTNVLLDLNLYVPGYPLPTAIQLLSIIVSGTVVTFNFTGSNTFTVDISTISSYPYYFSRLGNGSILVIGSDVTLIPTGTHTFTSTYVEPSLVFEISHEWLGVEQITVSPEFNSNTSNTPNYRVELPLVATGSPTTLTGNITLLCGYNFDVNLLNNTLNLSVGSYGIPLTCSDEFIASDLKDCGEIISYINGISPNEQGQFLITAGTNIVIVDGNTQANFVDSIDTEASNAVNANPHSIFIAPQFAQIDLCSQITPLPPSK